MSRKVLNYCPKYVSPCPCLKSPFHPHAISHLLLPLFLPTLNRHPIPLLPPPRPPPLPLPLLLVLPRSTPLLRPTRPKIRQHNPLIPRLHTPFHKPKSHPPLHQLCYLWNIL